MGVTIESKNYSIDMGYYGFNRLRTKVAELTGKEIGEHYKKLDKGIFLAGIEKEEFVLHKAKQMGLNIPNPIPITKLIDGDRRGLSMPREVLVDELDHVLESCIKVKVKFATTSSDVLSIDNLNKTIA